MTAAFTPSQRETAHSFVAYVFQDMVALWLARGWNAAGQHSVERLQADLTPAPLGYRRSMAVARQLFFFAQAWRVTGKAACTERAHAIFADLTTRFWDAQHGGWFFSLDDAGEPADARKDLYGHAFVMFALAHYAKVSGRAEAIDWARRTREAVRRHLLLPQGWFAQAANRDWSGANAALEQNPHMHLLEACMALHEATGDALFLQDAGQLVMLYADRLRSVDGAKVLEHFDAEGRPQREIGQHVQPGHLYEWYWLLDEYGLAAGRDDIRRMAQPLFAWANDNGVDPQHGGIYDQVDTGGAVISDRKRIWPVTECIKVHAIRAAQSGEAAAYAALDHWIGFIAQGYFIGQGRWCEYLRRDLTPDCDYLPATTPYHIAMAALKVLPLLGDDVLKVKP